MVGHKNEPWRIRELRKLMVPQLLKSLYPIARLRSGKKRIHRERLRRVLYVTPNHLSDLDHFGGGERYALELAHAMSKICSTTLLSSGTAGTHAWLHEPFSLSVVRYIFGADIVHCHHFNRDFVDLAIITARLFNKGICVTDHGGGRPEGHFDLEGWVDRFLLDTEFNQRASFPGCEARTKIIYGGYNPSVFYDLGRRQRRHVLFVGRVLPHKGVNYLTEAVPENVPLVIAGTFPDLRFRKLMEQLSQRKRVTFIEKPSDDQLRALYNQALVTVLPSVYADIYGNQRRLPELLGLTLIESMACGTPVICTQVGGMPEIVEDGVVGFVVNPNDSEALRQKIEFLLGHPDLVEKMGSEGRRRAQSQFTWDHVAKRCWDSYCEIGA